jgi:hypothetical protein
MPKAYPCHLRDVILARVAAGETVRAVCAGAGMPCAGTVQVWRQRDPLFRAALREALAKGRWRRFRQFDEARAGALLERLRNGVTIREALADPATMSQRAFRYWRATDVGFAEELARINRIKREDRVAWAKGRWRSFDRALADQILLRVGRGTPLRRVLSADKALPCLTVLARWRRERPEFDDELRVAMRASRYVVRARRLWSETLEAEIVERIARGASFRKLAHDPEMPCLRTLSNWMKRKPQFAEAVRWACRERELAHGERMVRIAERARGAGAGRAAPRINRLQRQNAWRSRWPGGRRGAAD